MLITAVKHTGIEEAHACIQSTIAGEREIKSTLKEIYRWEHSITRSQIFSIQMVDIPSFVSVHLVRHVTTVPFVLSKRIDRFGNGSEDRNTLVNHRFIANAEAILNIAKKRLCYKASPETREVVLVIKEEIRKVDPDLAYYMVPNCVFRGGICPEQKPCGHYKVKRFNGEDDEKFLRIEKEMV